MRRGGYLGGGTVWTGREMNTPADRSDNGKSNGQSKKSMSLLGSDDPLLQSLGQCLADVEISVARFLKSRSDAENQGSIKYWNEEVTALNKERVELEAVIDGLELKDRRKAVRYIREGLGGYTRRQFDQAYLSARRKIMKHPTY